MITEIKQRKALFWFRRDLRLEDNAGLYFALKECDLVAPIFIFDKKILNELPTEDRRVEFIWNILNNLKRELQSLGSDIVVKYGFSEQEVISLAKKFKVDAVYTNEDYEPNARQRDDTIRDGLANFNIEFKSYKDTVIFSQNDILTPQGQPYTVFTHYKNAWKKKLTKEEYKSYTVSNHYAKLAKFKFEALPSLESIGFKATNLSSMRLEASPNGAKELFERFKLKIIAHYKTLREVPSVSGVSYLSVYNRFGIISIRTIINQVFQLINVSDPKRAENAQCWLDELIWREFYMQLLYHYPHIAYESFKSEYKYFPWENNFTHFQSWCDGETGYPLVDAAMKQLNETGYMHNRLRMVVSSFLCKTLLIDYKMGEEYFALKLMDFDLSANNGGWQWAASTGCDNVPYLRMFNPIKQSEKIDPETRFIKKYLPIFKNVPSKYLHEPWKFKNELNELGVILGKDYPNPIVDYQERRKIALATYEKVEKLTMDE